MEVLQCDGCDFRAESYDDLKTHIQEVHTVFLQPADADESESLKDVEEEEDEERDVQASTSPKAGMSMLSLYIQKIPYDWLVFYWRVY